MPTLAFNRPQKNKVSAPVKPPLRVEDDQWRERAACKGANPRDFELPSEDTPKQPPNVLHRAITHCFGCQVRRDCVIDAIKLRDNGVIRGGIEFRDKMPARQPCRACGLPFGLEDYNGKCTFCASIRKCRHCKKLFPARYPWLKAPYCVPCTVAGHNGSRPSRRKREQ